jgi:TPR repeat protein
MLACAIYGNRLARALGVGRDDARAVTLPTKSCDQGVPAGCTGLAILFLEGRGVAKKDEARAAAMMSKGCGGHPLAGCDLGLPRAHLRASRARALMRAVTRPRHRASAR